MTRESNPIYSLLDACETRSSLGHPYVYHVLHRDQLVWECSYCERKMWPEALEWEDSIPATTPGQLHHMLGAESAAWPEVGGPPLVMWADRPPNCRHGVLGCEMKDSGPVITCSGCGTKWGPAR